MTIKVARCLLQTLLLAGPHVQLSGFITTSIATSKMVLWMPVRVKLLHMRNAGSLSFMRNLKSAWHFVSQFELCELSLKKDIKCGVQKERNHQNFAA